MNCRDWILFYLLMAIIAESAAVSAYASVSANSPIPSISASRSKDQYSAPKEVGNTETLTRVRPAQTIPGRPSNSDSAKTYWQTRDRARQASGRARARMAGKGVQVSPSQVVNSTPKGGVLPGDDTTDPFIISSLPFYESGTTNGFTDNYDAICEYGASSAPDVVYKFASDHAQYIIVDLCASSFDTKVYITDVSDPNTYLACNDDACGFQSQIWQFFLYAGQEILIIVDGYGTESGDYVIDVWEVSGNDHFDPIDVTGLPFYSQYTTTGKWNDYDEQCPDSSESEDVVFLFVPTEDMGVRIDLCNSSYDTKLFVYENDITPGAPFACNDDNAQCLDNQFNSLIECLSLTAFNTYYIVVDGWGNQAGDFELYIDYCDPPCWTGCPPEAIPEGEACEYSGLDDYNGGCFAGGSFLLIEPDQPICGTLQEIDGLRFDTDWYARHLFEGDSVTWCVTGNLAFEIGIMDISSSCSEFFDAFGAGNPCDTVYVGMRIPANGLYSFVVQPYPFGADWPCDQDPSYVAVLSVDPACEWGGCPIISTAESEGCDPLEYDDFNGGCYSTPPSWSVVPDNQYICGLTWREGGNWDEDGYLRHVLANETVTYRIQAKFPLLVYVYDVGGVCSYDRVIIYDYADPCDILTLQVTAATETDLALIILTQDLGNEYRCATGPWEYTFIVNSQSQCPQFSCDPGATPEGESCEITKSQGYNAGCNSTPPTYLNIAYDETICGSCWYGTAGFSHWRDTDWQHADVADGDSVVWCVTAEFAFDAFIVDVSPNCDFDSNITIVYDTGYACDTIYLSTRKEPGQDLKFIIAPRFFFPWLWCGLSEWNWEATLTKVNEACNCDCANDPACDGVTSIFDVTHAINVAFRGADAMPDPNGTCPWETTDVDCNGVTSIFDVTRLINVAFRGGDPATEFCDPCASLGN